MKTILCYVKDESGRYLSVNKAFLHCIQVGAKTDIVGLTDQEIPWGYPASHVVENDQLVLSSGQRQMFFETCLYHGVKQLFRSTKTPMVDTITHGKMIHGISIPVSDACLVFLSSQQSKCLKYFALGFTHIQIAERLNLSQKTVEHYLDAVKLKLGFKTRFELVEHAVERGLMGAF